MMTHILILDEFGQYLLCVSVVVSWVCSMSRCSLYTYSSTRAGNGETHMDARVNTRVTRLICSCPAVLPPRAVVGAKSKCSPHVLARDKERRAIFCVFLYWCLLRKRSIWAWGEQCELHVQKDSGVCCSSKQQTDCSPFGNSNPIPS